MMTPTLMPCQMKSDLCTFSFLYISILIMKCLIWNCCGCGKEDTVRVVKQLVRQFNPLIMVLLETKTSGNRADVQCDKFGFSRVYRVETDGLPAGIWLF